MGASVSRETTGGTQSVERALSLLEAFTEEHPERRVSELVSLTGLGQSTVSRLVGALEGLGFLEQDARSGLYRLGPRLVTLAGIAINQSAVHHQARQIAQNLAADLGLGANVAQRRDAEAFYICHFEGRLAPRAFTLVGHTAPLHATALGKALLSDQSAQDVEELLGADYSVYTPHTISDLPGLLKALDEVRANGYATEVEELAFGRACLAAPIRDRSRHVVAALSVSGPLSVIDLANRQNELASKVIECADQISTGLGYHTTFPGR